MAGEALSRGLLPVKNAFVEVGMMMILTVKTLISAVRPPYPYGEELVWQFLFVLKLSWFPLLISTFALNLGAPGLQAAGVLSLFGALDRLGGFFVVIAIRWIGPAGHRGRGRREWPAPRSPPIWEPGRSARSSTPCRCWASTRSRTWSCRASWR